MQKTTIEWTTENGMSWNPFGGCSPKSKGCANCYAETYANRFHEEVPKLKGTITNGRFNGVINLDEKELMRPTKRKKPTTFFISMSDPFHENIKFEWIDRVFQVMKDCPQHTFLLLTKRSEIARTYFEGKMDYSPLPNVWLGTSIENQHSAKRMYDLLRCPAAGHFVSAEPLLGLVDLENIMLPHHPEGVAFLNAYTGELGFTDQEGGVQILPYKLRWAIVGGESGAKKEKVRPMHPLWAKSLRAQSAKYDVCFFFKQWGCNKPCAQAGEKSHISINQYGDTDKTKEGDFVDFVWVGKTEAGNLLDGKQYQNTPFDKR